MTRVEGLTHQGLGRTADGQFLPRALPGEEVEVAADGTFRIVTPSADRVAAPCKHYKSCGGCAMQHASDDFVAQWKTDVVVRALSAHGLETTIRGIATSPPKSRRRAKFSGRRTKAGALVGFHARSSDTLVAVPECQLLSPALMAALPALEALTMISASRKGEVSLTVTETDAGPDILVTTDKELTPALRVELARLAQNFRVSRLVWGSEPVVTLVSPVQHFGRAIVAPPPGAFLQATKAGEAGLLESVQDAVSGATSVVDLFAGVGTFSLPLAAEAEVHAVEGEAEMLLALDQGWRATSGLKRVTTERRDLFRRPLEPDELRRFDAAVIDPPRAGAEAQVATLCASDIRRIVMVSCNPVTFARDAKTFCDAGFQLRWVDVIDQFRWSAHVELAALFTRS
jgi:23S rRNA (uracil1939-C5)-methyltransferase